MVNGKSGGRKNRQGNVQRGQRGKGNNLRGRGPANKNKKNVNNSPKKSQAWRLQRQQSNGGFVAQRYKQNGTKRVQSKQNIKINERKNQNNRQGFPGRRAGAVRGVAKPGLTRSRSRNNLATAKRFTGQPKGVKRVSSLPNLRDPNSVYNRLGYQSPAQVAYRNRVKRAKQLLLQRQSQRLVPNDRLVPRAAKPLTNLQQRALERRQQILNSQRSFNAGGLRSDQILRAQRRQQYNQKLLRMNAARVNPHPNVNFMCTLGDEYSPRPRSRSMSQGGSMSRRQLPRGRSPFRQNPTNFTQQLARGPLFGGPRTRSRSRSRSRSRTRTVPLIHSNTNVDDRTFSEVMYSVGNNLGVTGRTLNDRFTF
uniref:Baz1b_0 protein n=2 Tax=Fopius arisanus TaxID=64838 RepID=A0A0C9RW87_9HYME